MEQLDIYENLDPETSGEIPYLVDIQHGIHNELKTRIMVPLVYVAAQRVGIHKLCPVFTIQENSVFASIPEMAAYPVAELGRCIGTLASQRDELFAAVVFLMHGF